MSSGFSAGSCAAAGQCWPQVLKRARGQSTNCVRPPGEDGRALGHALVGRWVAGWLGATHVVVVVVVLLIHRRPGLLDHHIARSRGRREVLQHGPRSLALHALRQRPTAHTYSSGAGPPPSPLLSIQWGRGCSADE